MPKTPEHPRSSRVKNVAIVSPTTAVEPEVVAKIGPNDVLLGRGAPIINNEGNVRFRKVVNARKSEYIASCRHQVKNKIAMEVIAYIHSQKGRFLRKVDDTKDAEEKGGTTKSVDESTWVVADEASILQKVKQALREQDTKNIGTNNKNGEDSPQASGIKTSRQPEQLQQQQQQQHGLPPVPFDRMSSPSLQSSSADNNSSMLQLAYIQQQQERAAIVRELMTRQALVEDSSFLASPYGGLKRPFQNEFMMSPGRGHQLMSSLQGGGGGGGQFYEPSSMGYPRFPPDNVGLMNPYGFSQSQMMAVRGLATRLSPLSSCNAMPGSSVMPMQSGTMSFTTPTSGTSNKTNNKRARVGK